MYVREATWYQKQQRQRLKVEWIRRLSIFGLLFCACFGAILNWMVSMDKVHAQTVSSVFVQSQPLTMSTDLAASLVQATKSVSDVPGAFSLPTEDMLAETGNGSTNNTGMGNAETNNAGTNNIDTDNSEPTSYLIAIDAGHGGEDNGCSFCGVDEKDINLTLAQSLQTKLEEMGFEVLLTREGDYQLELADRVELANESGADAFISIHQNSCEESSATGIETWYYPSERLDNERLARLVEQYTVLYTKARDRGICEEDELYVIRESEMPSCLVETGFLSNQAEREKLNEEEYCEKIVQGIADAIQLYFYPKVMYLTFDDGPVAENTEAVLDILKEKGIKATFFVVGKNVERNPEIAKRIVEEGHTIGIHCYSHDYNEIYASVDSYLEDFEKAKQVVYEVTGEEVKLFRFPGGSINSYNKKVYADIIEAMTEKGYVYFDWNASLEDAVKNPTPEKILQNAKESTLGRKKVVMLAHDMVDTTVECLEELLDQFPEYEMHSLDESVEPIQF